MNDGLRSTPNAETAEKIRSFQRLPPGWHYGEGQPPDAVCVEAALQLNAAALAAGFEQTDASPGIEGEIQVTAYAGQHYLEVTVEDDGHVTFVQEADGAEIAYQNMTLDEAMRRIGAVGRDLGLAGIDNQSLSAMAADKSIQDEIARIENEFAGTEADGLDDS